MRTNADFGKFIYELKPQESLARLTLYNYLRNFTELHTPFTADTIFRFYLKALSFEHWQKNVLELGQEAQFLLERFLGVELQTDSWKKLKPIDQIQTIKLKNLQDQCEVIQGFIQRRKLNVNFQVFGDKDGIANAVLMYPKGQVQVMTFDDQAYIHQGQVNPLVLDRRLEYTSKLELASNAKQFVQVTPFITAKFHIAEGLIHGDYIRGYTLQSYKKIEINNISQEPQLLYAIKRIERFFIDRASEPLYVELVKILEETIEFLRQKRPGSLELAKKAHARGVQALDSIFVDDKLLPVLLKEIECYPLFDSTNSYPKPELPQDEELTNSFNLV